MINSTAGMSKPGFISCKKLFQYQEYKAGKKYNQGQPVVMMLFKAMVE